MIELSNLKKIQIGCKIAEFDVTCPTIGVIFRGMVLLQKGDRRWVSFASKARSGEPAPVYFQTGGFVDESKEKAFLKMVLEAVEKEMLQPVNFQEHMPAEPVPDGKIPF